MQNVSRIQRHPDTLIKNFFIAGLSQKTLKDDIFPEGEEKQNRDLFDLQPEILFSLFDEPEKMDMYLGQVFPSMVRIQYGNQKLIDPKFFSFMSVDMDGFNQYNHCLIFYERFTAQLIREDFDQGKYIEKLIHLSRKKEHDNLNEDEESQNHKFGQMGNNEKAKKLNSQVPLISLKQVNAKAAKDSQKVDTAVQLRKEIQKGMQDYRKSFRNNNRFKTIKISPVQNQFRATTDNITEKNLQSSPLLNQNNPILVKNLSDSLHKVDEIVDEDNFHEPQFGYTRADLMPEGRGSDAMYHKDSSISLKGNQQPKQDDSNKLSPFKDQSDQMKDHDLDLHGQTQECRQTFTTAGNKEKVSFKDIAQKNHSSVQITNSSVSTADSEYYFVPIAFVIQTEVEHHDIFKDILLTLFESIRVPDQVTDNEQQNLELAFAEFLAHLAFLISIPCPTFNTRFYIEFFDKTLTLTEPNFDEIPDKNQLAIRVLFEMLDVRTIMYCWKAILFDKTLVLISSQFSLQFYVAQALLQLLFPLTFQYSYVQPASKPRIGMVKSPFPIMLACSSLDENFEYFESLEGEHIAICDIDGSFTNNIDLPELENENIMLRSLSALKNFKGARYDSAFKEMYEDDLRLSQESFTIEARKVFFGILDQFLGNLCDGSCFRQDIFDPQDLVFINYFDHDEYLQWFVDTKNYRFAAELKESQLFVSFCDDWFDKKNVSNMLVYMHIRGNGFDLEEADRNDPTIKQKFDQRMEEITQQLLYQNQHGQIGRMSTLEPFNDTIKREKTSTGQKSEPPRSSRSQPIDQEAIYEWPKNLKVDFCWRLPVDCQRVMIFEKLAYTIQSIEQERSFRESLSDKCDLMDVQEKTHYKMIHDNQLEQVFTKIDQLKKLYQKKLPVYWNQLERANKIPSKQSRKPGEELKQTLERTESEMKPRKSVDDVPVQFKSPIDSNIEEQLQRAVTGGRFDIAEVDELIDLVEEKSSTNGTDSITPKSKLAKNHKFLKQVSFQQFTAEYDGFSQTDTDYRRKKLMKLRKKNKQIFCKNRIVELCYGKSGLIAFLDLMFTQFTQRNQVKCKFNYYFALRNQLSNIEHQINSALQQNHDKVNFREWYEKFNNSLASFIPQHANIQSSASEISSSILQPDFDIAEYQKDANKVSFGFCEPKLPTTVEETKVSQSFLQRSTTSILIKGIAGVTQENNEVKKDKSTSLFRQKGIGSDKWMLPVIPENVEHDESNNQHGIFNDLQKLVAFRTSYQYISIKQKLFFAFEDKQEAIPLIFREFLMFQQRDRQIFPASRFQELLQLMTQAQKKRIFTQIVSKNINNLQDFFQLRLMFEHELKEDDPDMPTSLDHEVFKTDFLMVQQQNGKNQVQKNRMQSQKPTYQTQSQSLPIANEFLNTNQHQLSSTAPQDFTDRSSFHSLVANSKINFSQFSPQGSFAQKPKLLLNPDIKVIKLMEQLLKIYMTFFDQKYFNEEKKEIESKEIIPSLLEQMKGLREVEQKKLSSREIIFTDNGEARNSDIEAIKRCFWINLFNFKILQKTLETLLVKPSLLKKQLQGATMIVGFMSSVQVFVQGEALNCYEIFKTMLKQEELQLMSGIFEHEYRSLSQMPASLRDMAVTEKHPMSSFAIYLPVKQLFGFTLYKKETFEEQLKEQIHESHDRIQICSQNFLQRIPKICFWIDATKPSANSMLILNEMIKLEAFRCPKLEAIKTILESIQMEVQSLDEYGNARASAHIFEIDNFYWRFDILELRANLRSYCIKSELWVLPSQKNNSFHISHSPQKTKKDSKNAAYDI